MEHCWSQRWTKQHCIVHRGDLQVQLICKATFTKCSLVVCLHAITKGSHLQKNCNYIMYLVLTPDIPNCEANVLVLHGLHIESCIKIWISVLWIIVTYLSQQSLTLNDRKSKSVFLSDYDQKKEEEEEERVSHSRKGSSHCIRDRVICGGLTK